MLAARFFPKGKLLRLRGERGMVVSAERAEWVDLVHSDYLTVFCRFFFIIHAIDLRNTVLYKLGLTSLNIRLLKTTAIGLGPI